MNYKDLAIQNYKRFCEMEGSEYIASEFAIEIILKLIKKYDVKNILEMGLGIGSISDSVLKFAKQHNRSINYVGTEANEFCLNALKTNVEDYGKIDLYPELAAVKDTKFDLIVIDGYDSNFQQIVKYCKGDTIIFIEGDRKPQTNNILEFFPNSKHVNVITMQKRKNYAHGDTSSEHYVGGGQLIFVNPTLGRKIFWFIEKAKTYIKVRIRVYKAK
ncbi:MAG TPA: hypothetical protein VK623_11850 [Flavobacterium sp.]|nr:hypothetical protein [Flavobacterium sp.]